MALDLDAIKFLVDTSELDSAITKIDKLGTAVTALNKPIEKLDKATGDASKSVDKVAKSSGEATDKVEALQKKLENTYKDLSQGFTKGESSILNYARTLGIAEDALKPIQDQLKLIGKLTSDPFDSAIGSIRSVTKEFEMMNHRADLASKGIILTAKQLKEYSRVADEVSAKITSQGFDPTSGKGLADYTKGVERLQAKYLGLAGTVSEARQAEQQNQQAIKDSAKATDFLTREMNRAENALNGMNESMNISTSNRLLRFKEGLKSAGVEAGVATTMLEKYEATLRATDAASVSKKGRTRKDELDYLARATSVQLGDIGVSLAGGQNPLIVMIQQGDQLRSVLNQVGGDAKEMQQAMSLAFKQIVVGFIDVGKALGSFVAGAFKDTAAEIVSFVGRLTGLGIGLEWAKAQFTAMTTESNKFTSALGRAGLSVIEFLGTNGIAALATGLGALVITLGLGAAALLQLSKEQTAVAQSNAQFGATFGASTEEVLAFNKELSTLGITSSKSAELFSEIVKAGGITKDMFIDVSVAASEFEKYVGGKATDAVKQFSDAIKDPIKELTDFGIKSGYVSKEQIELVKNLLETGEGVKAQEATVAILKQGYKSMANEAKAGMSSLDLSLIEVNSSLSALWNNFKNSETTGKIFKTFWETIAVIGSEVWFTLKAVGIEIGGIGAQIAAVLRGDFAGAKTIGEQMTQDAEAAAKAQKELVKRILEGASVSASVSAETRQQNSQELEGLKRKKDLNEYLQKGDKDNLSRSEYQSKQVEEWNKKLGISVLTEKEILAVRQKAGQEWDKAHKQKKEPTESFYDSSIKTLVADLNSATGAQEKYTKAQVDFLNITANPKWKELTDTQKKDITLKAEQAIAAEKLVIAQKEELKVQLELQKVWDTTVKARAAQDKIDFDLLDTTMALVQSGQAENEMLILQATLIGATDEVRKKSIKLKEIDIKYEKELAKIKAGTASDDAKKIAISDLAKWREQEEKNVNLIIANDAAEKLLAEYNRIRDGITDSIVTALFEGGKAGSKKLRDLIVAELKKPITMVVNALVNTLMNSVTGGVAGSAAGGMAAGALFGAGGLGGAMLGGAGWLTGATTLGGSLSAATSLLTSGVSGILPGLGMLAGALGPIGIGLSLLAGMDDSGTMHTGGGATYSAANGASASQVGFTLNESDISQSAVDFAKQFTTAIGQMLDATALAFGKTAGYEIATAFADDTSSDGAWGSLVIKKGTETILDWSKTQTSRWAPKEFADGEEGRNQYLAAVAKDVRDTLIKETPSWADAMLNALGSAPTIDGLTQTVTLINQTQSAFEAMGKASLSFAGISEKMTAELIKTAGGASQLISSLSTYYTNFYSEEERNLLETQRLQGEFAKLNKTMPTTREGFRAMVDAALAAGDSELVTKLLALNHAFASITGASKDATQAAQELADAIKESYDKAKSETDEALAITKEVINREKEKAQESLASAEQARNALQSIFDLFSSNIRELYMEVTSTSLMLVSQANAVVSNAVNTGVLPSNDILSQAIGAIRGSFGSTNYASKFESDKARLQFAGQLSALSDIAVEELSSADSQVSLLKKQIEQYDLMVKDLNEQLKVLRDISTVNMSIDQSLANLLAIMAEERKLKGTNSTDEFKEAGSFGEGFSSGGVQNDSKASKGTTTSLGVYAQLDLGNKINNLDWTSSGVNSSAKELAAFAKANGMTQQDIAAVIGWSKDEVETYMKNAAGIPAFVSGGFHDGGVRLVGENGPELEVTGPSRIYNASQTASMLSGSDSAEETAMLRYEVRAVASSTAKLTRIVERLIVGTNQGDALQVKTAV